jgi:hypothetical protein
MQAFEPKSACAATTQRGKRNLPSRASATGVTKHRKLRVQGQKLGTRFHHGEASKNGKREYYQADESPARFDPDWRRFARRFVQAVPSRFTGPKGYRAASSPVMDLHEADSLSGRVVGSSPITWGV